MALVKCKECGEDVSTKAKACQKCGAVPAKQTSLIGWFITAAIIYGIYAASKDTPEQPSPPAINVTSSSGAKLTRAVVAATPAPIVLPKWGNSTASDPLTGKKSSYVSSPLTGPDKSMGFPYEDVEGWLGVGCDGESEWAYIGFNGSPNLADSETQDGYDDIVTRIRWDESVEDVSLTQKWAASFLHFNQDATQISKIASSNSVLLELQWYGEPKTYFTFSLNGSSEAIAEMRRQCGEY